MELLLRHHKPRHVRGLCVVVVVLIRPAAAGRSGGAGGRYRCSAGQRCDELSLEGYALLKVAGKNQGLEGLRKELSARFAKSGGKSIGLASGEPGA